MFRTFLLLLVVALSPIVVRADQITTGGFSWHPGVFGFTNYNVQFSGASFAVNNGFAVDTGGYMPCSPCAAGTTVSLSSSVFLDPTDWELGTVIVDGVTYPIFQGLGRG